MSETQRERVDNLERRLLTTEVARRRAVAADDWKLRSDLANINREAIGAAEPKDLRSLVTRWMLQLGEQAELASRDTAPPRIVTGVGACGACGQVEREPHVKWCKRIDGRSITALNAIEGGEAR